ATTDVSTLPLHDALPIWRRGRGAAAADRRLRSGTGSPARGRRDAEGGPDRAPPRGHHAPAEPDRPVARGYRPARQTGRPGAERRSEEHTSELQSREKLVC